MGSLTRSITLWICLAAVGVCWGLDVDMDPCPRFPLRKGDDQVFLVHLSNAKSACRGKVAFDDLPEGLEAEPAGQDFALAPGASQLLVFTIRCTAWGEEAVVRPTVTVDGAEPVSFPAAQTTTLVRDAKSLDKPPLDEQGLLAYFSCGDASETEYHHFDRSVGNKRFWEEGIWYHDGGVKGRAVFGMNALPYPRHRWSKFAYETLNNIYHKRGTMCFWIRKSRRRTEIPYSARFTGDPATTWKLGPTAMRGHEGEGLAGHIWSPQSIYVRWFLKQKRPWRPFKPGSDSFLSLRRYKAVTGLTGGFLEATIRAMRGDIYHVQAPFEWSENWRHVALLWDEAAGRLEIYLDGELAGGRLMCNGRPATEKRWYSAPWHVATFCNAAMSICCVNAEGGRGATDRDEYYIFNRALSADEIRANMKASTGKVVTPTLAPAGGSFRESLAVDVRSLWANPTLRYTTDGSEPTESSPVCGGPIVLRETTTVKVKSFLDGFAASDTATATFEYLGADRQKPRVRRIVSINAPTEVMVCFDEPVDPTTAANVANYAIDGHTVRAAALDPDGQVVRLTAAAPLGGGTLKLSVRGVADRAAAKNVMDDLVDAPFKVETMEGLIGYYGFDVLSGPTVKDLSSSRIDGTAWDDLYAHAKRVPGVKGKAISLDGVDDLVDLSKYADEQRLRVDPKSPHNVDEGTVALWVRGAPDGVGYKKHIIGKTYAYEIWTTNGNLQHTRHIKIVDGEWHHLVVTYTGRGKDNLTFYLDGRLVHRQTGRFLRHHMMGVGLGVGGGGYGQPRFFKGELDEVMLFNRVLSAAEAQSLHASGRLGE